MPFDMAFFHPDDGNIFAFTKARTLDIFLFLFENEYTARGFLLLWIAAVAYFFVRDLTSPRGATGARHLGILLVLPFVAVWGAAVAGYYPYVGSRHTVFLAPFIIAAVSFLLAAVCRQKIWAAITLAVLFVGISNTSGKMGEQAITKENQSRALMTAAVHYMHSIPPGDLILSDYQSAIMITYYLCGPNVTIPVGTLGGTYSKFTCNGHSVAQFPILGGWYPRLSRTSLKKRPWSTA